VNTPTTATDHGAIGAALERDLTRRRRDLVTPEGLSLPLTIASRGARAGALLLDLTILALAVLAVVLAFVALGIGFAGLAIDLVPQPAVELMIVAFIIILFLARYFYFLWFELGPRGATPGKRIVGIRVAARPGREGTGGRLTAEAVIARNLLRDVEIFLPASLLLTGGFTQGITGIATAIWLGVFVLFPFFNRDHLRAGDLVAGTWVVEAERRKLGRALSLATAPAGEYRFGAAELSVYGEHELQVLEGILRTGNEETMREVAEAICRKIGWQAGTDDARAFLAAFYAALRAHLERDLRFGRRKKNKFA